MCLNTGGSGGRTIIKQEPILPGPASTDDKVNDAVVTNITDRSKQKEARGQFRDYGGLDANRTFDEKAATGRKDPDDPSYSTTTKQGRQSSSKPSMKKSSYNQSRAGKAAKASKASKGKN